MTMRMWFNVPALKCLKYSDSGQHSEFYFTYQAYFDLDDNQRSLTQGFSLGCPLDDGYSFGEGESRQLNDPKFMFELPELSEGQTKVVTLDVFLWESDDSTIETKKVFTNAAAAKLWEIYNAAAQQKKKTKDEFLKWLKDQGLDLVKDAAAALGASAASAAAGVTIGKALIPFISWAIELAKLNSDDFIGLTRIQLEYTKTPPGGSGYKYRWILNDGAAISWIPRESAPVDLPVQIVEANGGNSVAAHMLMQVLFDPGPTPPPMTIEKAESLRLVVPS